MRDSFRNGIQVFFFGKLLPPSQSVRAFSKRLPQRQNLRHKTKTARGQRLLRLQSGAKMSCGSGLSSMRRHGGKSLPRAVSKKHRLRNFKLRQDSAAFADGQLRQSGSRPRAQRFGVMKIGYVRTIQKIKERAKKCPLFFRNLSESNLVLLYLTR